MQGANSDFSAQDLFEAIEKKDYPGWTVYAQVLTPSQAETFKYNVLDLTK
jgi:catalase